ncbi:MAG TPA: RNA methyltransferase [Bacteroidales bacterium]|nr:RNA methyltransferase [Bacteroidales bacterium]
MITKDFNHIIEAISIGFKEVMEDERALNQVSTFWIKQNPNWDEQSRGFFAETLMEVVRWWRLLNTLVNNSFSSVNKDAYRDMVLTYLLIKKNDTSVSELIPKSTQSVIFEKYTALIADRAIAQSIPDWLDLRGNEELGEHWNNEIKALNSLPPIVIRVNSLKTSTTLLLKRLTDEGFQVKALNQPNAIILTKRADIFKSSPFLEGQFEIQDASSQLVAPFLDVEPGMRVVDACAGHGGKTLHLGCLMKNKGKIIALDNADWKLDELMKRSARAGLSIIETRTITTTKIVKRLKDKADRVLLDVPCSGLGVLRRNPDSKWRLTPEKIEEIKTLQAYILDKYTQMVKPGGKFVYSTCSILPSENGNQIQAFIERSNGAFTLEEEQTILPSISGFDGFYMARLIRAK